MNKENQLNEIATLVWQIRQLEKPIETAEGGNDQMDKVMADQFRHKQRRLIEKVLVELTRAQIGFALKGRFIRELATYLEKTELGERIKAACLEPEWKRIDRVLAAQRKVA